ncbi:glycosyltransferase [Bradyrhizobium barranii subsp. apii]|uniref:Glycosyltransferase n=1 Tax=Bradyrhizobium barranii subsp. apii TaxID=2819348 RepID=A0A8T5V9D3_9BRAD|nr:glycosyltransferase [Bradyrhizobium barranii]UPT87454.1 glycosyltransferase [Bradyrhizobium barranii subsp. apii]
MRNDIRFEVVSNGARKSLYYPSTLAQRRKFRADVDKITNLPEQGQILAEKKLIGFVGRVENSKGLQLLHELSTLNSKGDGLGDASLFVQFRFQPASREYEACQNRARQLRETNKDFVWIYADQAPRGANRPMRHFDVLLLPSLSEVQPMVVLEALSSGVPVVATRSTKFFDELRKLGFDSTEVKVVDLPASLRDGSAGIADIASGDAIKIGRELKDAIEAIPRYTDAQRVALSKKAELAGFSDATMYKRYLRLYDDTIDDFGKRHPEASVMSRVTVPTELDGDAERKRKTRN